MWPTVLFALTWNVPCAPAPDVPALLGNAEGEAVVTVQGGGDHWHLEVAFPNAVRTLDAKTCADAARAALLFLKLGATPAVDRAPVEAKPLPPEPPPPPEPPKPWVVRLGAGAALNGGALPAPSARVQIEAGLSKGAAALFLAVRAGFPGTYAGGPVSGAGFVVHPALGAQLSACALPSFGPVRAGLCGVFAAEWWRAAGVNVDLPRGGHEAWVAAGADARVVFRITARLFGFAAGGVRFSLRRPQLSFEGFGVAFTVPLVSGEGALGLGWQW